MIKIIETNFDDLKVLKFLKISDLRGEFIKPFINEKITPFMTNISEVYFSTLKRNGFRGLHYQKGDAAQTKFVCCLAGEIEDIAVDLRKEKDTYGKVFKLRLKAFDDKGIIIPKGFAHGIYAHKNSTIVNFCDKPYSPENEHGISPFTIEELNNLKIEIISTKDRSFPNFKKIIND